MISYAEEIAMPIFKFLVCIGALLLIGAIINIIKDKVRGKSKQKILKKRDISSCGTDVIALSLDKIKGYKRIITNKNYIIRINEYSIDAILICDYYGILSGEEVSEKWNFKSDKEEIMVENPIIEFEKYINNIENKIGNYEIKKYILLGGNTFLNIQFKNIEVLRSNNIYYELSTKMEAKKYTEEEIDNIYQKIIM